MEIKRIRSGKYSVSFNDPDIVIDKKRVLLELAYNAAMEVYEPTEDELEAERELQRFCECLIL